MKTCSVCQVKYPNSLEFCPRCDSPLPMDPSASSSPASDDPLIGAVIDGRYRIESLVGSGGVARVYQGTHVGLGKKVAVKIFQPGLFKGSEKAEILRKRFLQEGRLASTVHHPNIVDIYDVGEVPDGPPFLVMEFLPGGTLMDALYEAHGAVLTPVRACHIASQMARGLQAVHDQRIIHRDVKPADVFLLKSLGGDLVKMIDFGLARLVTSSQRFTETGMCLGTPDYMSPEQCRGLAGDCRMDQYSLGCVLYEMLIGEPPFLADRGGQILTMHVYQPVIPPKKRRPGLNISDALEAIVMRLLCKRPEDRFSSMQEVALALEQLRFNARPLRVFFSYAKKDRPLLDQMETHLAPLLKEKLIETWHERQIAPGQERHDQIDRHIEDADLILLLVSPDFLASLYEGEMHRALARHTAGAARVIPILLRDADWEHAPFGHISALPADGIPVKRWKNRDQAWREVARGIRRVIEEIRAAAPP